MPVVARTNAPGRAALERALSLAVLLTAALLMAATRVRVLLILVLALAGIVAAAAVTLHPLLATCLLTFLAYGNVSAAYVPGLYSAALGLAAVAMVLRALLVSDSTVSGTRVDLALLVYVLTLLLSVMFSPTPEASGPVLVLIAKSLLLYLVLVNLVRDTRSAVFVSCSLVAGAGLGALLALWAFSQGNVLVQLGVAYRASGLAGNANELAIIMVTAMPIAAYTIAFTRNKALRVVLAAVTLALIAANFTTLARTGLISMVVVLVAIAVRERRRAWVKTGVAAFIVLLPLLIPAGFWLRLAGGGFLTGDYSSYLRSGAMRAGVTMFSENPVTGVGLGAYLDKSTEYGDILWSLVAHNMYLHVAAESGLLGLAGMVFVIAATFGLMRQAERTARAGSPVFYLARAYQMSYVAFLICGLLTSIQLNQSFWFMPAASVFLLQAARREGAALPAAS
jgi:O-antigen ligase